MDQSLNIPQIFLTNVHDVSQENDFQRVPDSDLIGDVDMAPSQHPEDPGAHVGFQADGLHDIQPLSHVSIDSANETSFYDANDDLSVLDAVETSSMPSLRSLSDSSEDLSIDSEDEVRMMHDMQPVDDDHDSNWTDNDGDVGGLPVDVNELPPLEPIPQPSRRRARVEDDQDEDRDRRHPSERTGTAAPASAANRFPIMHLPQLFRRDGVGGVGLRPHDPQQPNVMQFLEQRFIGAAAPRGGIPGVQGHEPRNATENTSTNNNHENVPPPDLPNNGTFGGVATFTWSTDGRMGPFQAPEFFPANPAGNGEGQEENHNTFDTAFDQFAQFLQHIDGLLGMAEPPEDPERAKKLVEGLEIVAEGLVRRMEKVGGAPGGHEADGVLGGNGCAICWDTLLDSEGDGFGKQKTPQDTPQESEDSGGSMAPPSDPPPSMQPKIVCLPCAHVFHASCLVPWFSRPRQTTCPTCRFDVDPENLTYIPRAFQPRPSPAQTDGAPANGPPQDQAGPHNFSPAAAAPQPPQPQPGAQPAPQLPPRPPGATPIAGFQAVGLASMLPITIQQQMIASLQAAMRGAAQAGQQQGPVPRVNVNLTTGGNPDDPHHHHHHHDGDDHDHEHTHTHDFVTVDIDVSPLPFPPTDVGAGGENATMQDFMGDFQNAGDAAQAAATEGPQEGPRIPNPTGFPRMFFSGPPGMQPNTGGRGEKKEWSLPPAPGPTLRQRIEEKEREAGLRCFDMSCGVGPDDDDPFPAVHGDLMKQLSIRASKDPNVVGSSVCPHTFHPSCLVSAERVAGWGGEDVKAQDDNVEVSCPVCRAVGHVTREEWQEGVKALG